MGRTGGLGEGTLTLIVLWSIVAFVAVLSRGTSKPKYGFGKLLNDEPVLTRLSCRLITTLATAVAGFITVVLVLIPRSEEGSQPLQLDPDVSPECSCV